MSYDTAKNWEIPREELQLVKRLGDGNFATVYLGRWRGVIEGFFNLLKNFLDHLEIRKIFLGGYLDWLGFFNCLGVYFYIPPNFIVLNYRNFSISIDG